MNEICVIPDSIDREFMHIWAYVIMHSFVIYVITLSNPIMNYICNYALAENAYRESML